MKNLSQKLIAKGTLLFFLAQGNIALATTNTHLMNINMSADPALGELALPNVVSGQEFIFGQL